MKHVAAVVLACVGGVVLMGLGVLLYLVLWGRDVRRP